MMKMLRIRTMPARIANELRMRKNWERDFAPSVALSTEIFFSVNAHGIAGGVTGSYSYDSEIEMLSCEALRRVDSDRVAHSSVKVSSRLVVEHSLGVLESGWDYCSRWGMKVSQNTGRVREAPDER